MKTKILKVIIFLVFITGLVIFLYPYGTKWLYEQSSEKVVTTFYEEIEQNRHTAEESDTSDTEADESSQVSQNPQLAGLYEELQAYNLQLYEEGQSNLKDPFSYEESLFDLTEYGFSENVIGVLWIPRLELELPIYMGASYENLAKGVGLLGNTSVPLGGENTNVVLAGHRGWKGIPMFRNIQAIQKGDKIQITTPWDTLVYRVTELIIVPKDDTRVIYIEEGSDRITLLTCHPYTKNEQRYVVVAERSYEEADTKENDLVEAEKTESVDSQQVEVITDEGSVIANISTMDISPVFNEGVDESAGGGYSNVQIWLETWGPIIGIIGVVLAVVIVGIAIRRMNKKRL